jgi:CheY-like chemotaxis protein
MILLVDDDVDDQLLFVEALREISDHTRCEIANNGEEALSRISTMQTPDVVFLDLNMPIMNGFDCLTEIRKQDAGKQVPIVIFSTTNDPVTIRKTFDLGANAYFRKPNDFSTMRSKLKSLLESDLKLKKRRTTFSLVEFLL